MYNTEMIERLTVALDVEFKQAKTQTFGEFNPDTIWNFCVLIDYDLEAKSNAYK